ncbi:MAG TPA: hypothetical protein VIM65_15285 [Cyclobacteriaceae bacterium]
MGYTAILVYFWLDSVELAKERVKYRVQMGGHNIAPDVIERRYKRGIHNLFKDFIPICDYWILIDNSSGKSILLADGHLSVVNSIYNADIWNRLSQKS